MAAKRKQVIRPNLGGTLRPQAEAPRRQFLYTDVTKAEHDRIQQYCVDRQISVSQFLAELVLREASRPKAKRKEKVTVRAEFELAPEELDKLELLTRLHQKESIGEYIRDLVRPELELQRVHTPLETMSLRFYLSAEEHEKVKKHIESTGISARNYGAMLALRELAKKPRKRKQLNFTGFFLFRPS